MITNKISLVISVNNKISNSKTTIFSFVELVSVLLFTVSFNEQPFKRVFFLLILSLDLKTIINFLFHRTKVLLKTKVTTFCMRFFSFYSISLITKIYCYMFLSIKFPKKIAYFKTGLLYSSVYSFLELFLILNRYHIMPGLKTIRTILRGHRGLIIIIRALVEVKTIFVCSFFCLSSISLSKNIIS